MSSFFKTVAALPPDRRNLLLGTGCLAVGGQILALSFSPPNAPDDELGVAAYFSIAGRLLRNYSCALSCLSDYKAVVDGQPLLDVHARRLALGQFHERSAVRVTHLCAAHGGLYVKIGQHVAQLPPKLLPPQYAACATLLDACPVTPWTEARTVLGEDLGTADPESLFRGIDPTPLASASLAQVHAATLLDGTPVAVKIQHPGLRAALPADLGGASALAVAVRWLTGGAADLRWLVAELRASLPLELNFEAEAANLERARALLTGRPSTRGRVVVPLSFPALSGARVLTMSLEAGISLHSADLLTANGVAPAAAAALVWETYFTMLLEHGFVHCDPHAANWLARPRSRGGDNDGSDDGAACELVLLDHGLYHESSVAQRHALRQLWRGLLLGDAADIRAAAAALGIQDGAAGGAATAFAAESVDVVAVLAQLLTGQRWAELTAPGGQGGLRRQRRKATPPGPRQAGALEGNSADVSASDEGGGAEEELDWDGSGGGRAVTAREAGAAAAAVGAAMASLPRHVLLMVKAVDELRAISAALGDPPEAVEALAAVLGVTLEAGPQPTRGRLACAVARLWERTPTK